MEDDTNNGRSNTTGSKRRRNERRSQESSPPTQPAGKRPKIDTGVPETANPSTNDSDETVPELTLLKIVASPGLSDELKRRGITRSSDTITSYELPKHIHPIFAKKNWCDGILDEAVWDAIQPALVLATKFLSPHYHFFDFWPKIMFGKAYRRPVGGPDLQLFTHEYKLQMVHARQILEQMSQVVRFYPRRHKDYPDQDRSAASTTFCSKQREGSSGISNLYPFFGETPTFERELWQDRSYMYTWNPQDHLAIDFHRTLWIAATIAMDDDSMMRRVNFRLAALLIHELAHAAYFFTRYHEYEIDGREPCLDNCFASRARYNGKFDLGTQWEMWALGSPPNFIWARKLSSEHNTEVALMPDLPIRSSERAIIGNAFALYKQTSIDRWFSPKFWSDVILRGKPAVSDPEIAGYCTFGPGEDVSTVRMDLIPSESDIHDANGLDDDLALNRRIHHLSDIG